MTDPQSLLEYERGLWLKGLLRVAGVDEAGRGPLAGPVVAAALVFESGYAQKEYHGLLSGLTDSKKLTESRREHFYNILSESPCVRYSVGMSDSGEIDEINILQATYRAMARAVDGLSVMPDHVLVDGLPVKGLPCDSTSIVKGDSLSLSIAAASIIAKVTRDRLMIKLHSDYPEYGFDSHKGYGSRRHIQALLEFGPSPVHRESFRPVREALQIKRRKAESPAGDSGQMELGMQ